MSKAALPSLTHLQFLVLGILADRDAAGRTVRAELDAFGIRRSGPAFYQMMSRLETAGLVEGWYEQATVGDQAVTERKYRRTSEGTRLWLFSRAFYERAAGPAKAGPAKAGPAKAGPAKAGHYRVGKRWSNA